LAKVSLNIEAARRRMRRFQRLKQTLYPATVKAPLMPDPSSPVVICGDRGKSFKMLAMAGVLATGSAFGVSAGKDALVLLLGCLFFGFVALQSLVALIRPPKLVIDAEGLTWRGMRSWRVHWSDVERFRLMALRRSSTVLIDYREGRVPIGAWTRFRQPKEASTNF